MYTLKTLPAFPCTPVQEGQNVSLSLILQLFANAYMTKADNYLQRYVFYSTVENIFFQLAPQSIFFAIIN